MSVDTQTSLPDRPLTSRADYHQPRIRTANADSNYLRPSHTSSLPTSPSAPLTPPVVANKSPNVTFHATIVTPCLGRATPNHTTYSAFAPAAKSILKTPKTSDQQICSTTTTPTQTPPIIPQQQQPPPFTPDPLPILIPLSPPSTPPPDSIPVILPSSTSLQPRPFSPTIRPMTHPMARDLRSRRQVTPLGDDKWRPMTDSPLDLTTLQCSPSPQTCSPTLDVCAIPPQPPPPIDAEPITAAGLISKYQSVYPSFRLILSQIQQRSLWDRLLTHCTGRDLLCKIVQHSAGLLRCILFWWDTWMRQLARVAAFRRMFFRGVNANKLVDAPSTAVAPVAAAEPPAETPTDAASPPDWVPPEESSSTSMPHRLKHISYTMYRARQILRLGRWLYDIPDVKDSAIELWYGTSEEKSIEEEEEEELWEEHERLHVVRSTSRRASFDGSNRSASAIGLSTTSSVHPSSSSHHGHHHRDSIGGGRGTFLFPVSSNSLRSTTPNSIARSSSLTMLPQLQQQQQQPQLLSSTTPATFERVPSNSSIASTTSMTATEEDQLISCITGSASPSLGLTASNDSTSTSKDSAEDESDAEDTGKTLLEWTVGVIDLTNSLMGLLIDASDDVDFIASLGLLPSRVGDVAGSVSSYLWMISSAIDVGMCCFKLHVYRQEMAETLKDKLDELQTTQAEQRVTAMFAAAAAARTNQSDSLPGPMEPRSQSAPNIDQYAAIAPASKSASSPPTAPPVLLTLCTSDCDVDCVHIEYLRFYRYLGELGLAVCGVIIGDGDGKEQPLEVLLEASGLFSGLATFVKRGATHARSNKFHRGQQLAINTTEDDDTTEDEANRTLGHEQLYS